MAAFLLAPLEMEAGYFDMEDRLRCNCRRHQRILVYFKYGFMALPYSANLQSPLFSHSMPISLKDSRIWEMGT